MKFPEMIYWLKSEDEMRTDGMPEEAIANTQLIADKCDVTIPLDRLLVPHIDVPEGYTTDTYLSKLCYDGLFKYTFTNKIDVEKYKERLKFELDVIIQKELSGYFLIVYDFIKWSNDHGIMTGPGRGSAAGSLVSFLIGITKLDPIEYDLLFERFLNPERKSYPDVDVDIEYARRHEVIRYVTEKYGADCVCQIGTFGTMSTKAVLKDVARALDIPFEIVNEVNKKIPVVYGTPYTLHQCLYGDEKKGYEPIPDVVEASKEYPQLFKVALALENNPRHSSAHASGVVISPVAVEKVFPLMTNKDDEMTSQYDMRTLEELGVIKFDFLGLKTLSVIRDTCNYVRDRHGININIDRINLADPNVYKLFTSGETDGVFQVESPGMKQLLRSLRPRDFSAIIAAVALYRPGPMENIPAYTSEST
jgi:DNA polymerase-3 subunit alpha